MEEYVSPSMVKLTGEDEAIGEYGNLAAITAIGAAWAWY